MTSTKANIRNRIILGVLGICGGILIISLTCYFVTKRRYSNISDAMLQIEVRAAVRPARGPSQVSAVIRLDPVAQAL
jgi:hypothetical protein